MNKFGTHEKSKEYVTAKLKTLGYSVEPMPSRSAKYHLEANKDGKTITIYVAGIRDAKSRNWNFNKHKFGESDLVVLVNLHAKDTDSNPEFFVAQTSEIEELIHSNSQSAESSNRLHLYNKTAVIYKDNWKCLES
jgi:hypothetical protein